MASCEDVDEAAGLLAAADEKAQADPSGDAGGGGALEETAKQLAALAQTLQLQLGGSDGPPSADAVRCLSGVLFEANALSSSLTALGVLPVQLGDGKSGGLEDEEGLSADTWEVTPYRPPTVERAEAVAAAAKYRGGKASLCSTGCDELGEMGVGVELYFRMLLMFSLVFAAMSAIALPMLSLNKEGHGVSAEKVDPDGWVLYSLGNMGLHVDNIPKLGGCLPEGKVDCSGTVINGTFAATAFEASYMISFCDFMLCWFFMLFIVALSWKIGDIVQRNDEKNVTAADYGVLVRDLPAAASEEQIAAFFSERYDLAAGPHVEWVMPSGFLAGVCGKGARRVAEAELRERHGREWDEQQKKEGARAAKEAGREKAAAKAAAQAAKKAAAKAAKAAKAEAKKGAKKGNAQDAQEEEEEAAPVPAEAAAAAAAAAAAGEESAPAAEAAPAAVGAEADGGDGGGGGGGGAEGGAEADPARAAYIEAALAYTPHPGWLPVSDLGHLTPLKSADGQEDPAQHTARQQAYAGSWVAEVEVAHPVGAQLRKYGAIKKLDMKLRTARAMVKKFRFGSPDADDAKMQKALAALEKLQGKMDKQMEKMPTLKKGVSAHDCVAALVIFNNEESFDRCVADYKPCARGGRYFGAKGQPKGLRFPLLRPDPPPGEGGEGGEGGGEAAPEEVAVAVEAPEEEKEEEDPVAAAAALLKGADAKTQEKEAVAAGKKPKTPKKPKKPKKEKAPPTDEEVLCAPCPVSDAALHTDGLDYWPVRVDALSEPSNVLWENLETSDEERAWRKRFTNFVTFVCLLVSFAFIYSAQSAKKAFDAKKPKPEQCGSSKMAGDIAAVHFGTYDFRLPMQKIEWSAEMDGQVGCRPDAAGRPTHFFHYKAARYAMGGGAVYQGAPLKNPPLPGPGSNVSSIEPFAAPANSSLLFPRAPMEALARSEGGKELCGGGCTNVFALEAVDRVCAALPCVSNLSAWAQLPVIKKSKVRLRCRDNYARGAIAGCYCQAKLNEALASGKGPGTVKAAYPQCAEFVDDHLVGIAVAQIAVLIVAIVNILLKSTLKALAKFERNFTVSNEATSVSTKIFFATFLNTALIVLVVNGALPNISSPLPGSGILEGEFSSISAEWYAVVAVALTGNMMLNIFVPHVGGVVKMVIVQPLMQRLKKGKLATQRQLNELYEGPPFEIETRFPVVLNSLFVTMMYSAGIPILLPFCAASMFLSYQLDKTTLLRMYARPPMYDESLAVQTQQMLPAALILHLGLAVWMYGDPDTLKSPVIGLSSFVGRPVDQSNAAEVDEAFAEFLTLVAPYDPMGDRGFIAKIVRLNVVPIFLSLVAVVVGVVLRQMGLLAIVLEVVRQSVGRVLKTMLKVLARLARRVAAEVKKRKGGVAGGAKVAPEGDGAPEAEAGVEGGGEEPGAKDGAGGEEEEEEEEEQEIVLPTYTGPFYKPLNPPSMAGSTDSIWGLLSARYTVFSKGFGSSDQGAVVTVLVLLAAWVGNTFGGARGYMLLWFEVLVLGIGGSFFLVNIVADAPPAAGEVAARRGSTARTALGREEEAENKLLSVPHTWVLEGNLVYKEWRDAGADLACERPHAKGDRMLTWEAMADIHSYRMQHNRKYMDALLALSAMDFSKAAELEKERVIEKEKKRVEKAEKAAAKAAAKTKKGEEKAAAKAAKEQEGGGGGDGDAPAAAAEATAGVGPADAAPAADEDMVMT